MVLSSDEWVMFLVYGLRLKHLASAAVLSRYLGL